MWAGVGTFKQTNISKEESEALEDPRVLASDPEVGGNTILRNVDKHLQIHCVTFRKIIIFTATAVRTYSYLYPYLVMLREFVTNLECRGFDSR